MRVLQAVQQNFDLLGFRSKLSPLSQTLLMEIAIIASGIFLLWIFLFHEADSPHEYMESLYFIVGFSAVSLSAASMIFNTETLFSFIHRVDGLANERFEKSNLKEIYEKTDQLVEKCSEHGFFVIKNVIVHFFVLPKAMVSFYIYFTTDLDGDAFNLPLPIWFPFNWKNPIGYLVAVVALLLFASYMFQYVGCFKFLALGAFIFLLSMVKDLKEELRSINRMAYDKNSRTDMYGKFSEFIRLHAETKQLISVFSELYDITLTVLFVSCMIEICVVMLLVQIQISYSQLDSTILLEATCSGFWSSILTLFVCELGQRFTNAVEEIDDVINQLDWYLFPGEIQQLLPTVVLSAQEPAVIKCFGNILCARKQFRKVVKAVYTCFMVLRKFYK